MADWSQLPPELLTLIANRLETRFDVLRFRSVCSSWRSAASKKVYPIPAHLPLKTEPIYEFAVRNIVRDTFYLVRSVGSHNNQTADADPGCCCWLVKRRDGTTYPEEDSRDVGMRFVHPLSNFETKFEFLPSNSNFPKVLDLTNFQVIELGQQFVARYYASVDHGIEPQYTQFVWKVGLMWPNNNVDFMILALFRLYLGRLFILRSGDKEWTSLDVRGVQDFISFNGKFYVIEEEGKTLVVDQYLNVSSLEHVGSPTSKKFLVESRNCLLAVEMHGMLFHRDPLGVRFRIFRLNEEELKWNEMASLADRILFVGLDHAISVSSSQLPWGRGNLIFYIRCCFPQTEDGNTFVFDLESGCASPLQSCLLYRNLFWPPPDWVTSALPSPKGSSEAPEKFNARFLTQWFRQLKLKASLAFSNFSYTRS